MTEIIRFDRIAASDEKSVGGKGWGLGRLVAAGLPVPTGFCLSRTAYQRLGGTRPQTDATLAEEIRAAYRDLGSPPVAVRSSATAEDSAGASFAGQQESILGVCGEDAVLAAIGQCWAGHDSERARVYRRKQGVHDQDLAIAVVVQRLVPSDVSGVLFTRDPLDPTNQRMLVEASWGLGESVVSGRVTPDRFHLDRDTGSVVERHIAVKRTMRMPAGPCGVEAERQAQPCLDDARLAELAVLGRRVEECFGDSRDVEWAWAEGQFWLLQARPITAASAAEREQVRQEEIAALRQLAAPEGTVWSRFNLAEVLPAPTPMTWAIVRRFLSGNGGLGRMYRDLGFHPDPALRHVGIYDLICGRPYCNLSREPRMQYRWLPLEHSFAQLKAEPARAFYTQPALNPARAGWWFWLLLPWTTFGLALTSIRLFWKRIWFTVGFCWEVLPEYLEKIEREAAVDLSQRQSGELLNDLERRIRLTVDDFAREGLKPTVFAALAAAKLEAWLSKRYGKERARVALIDFMTCVPRKPVERAPVSLRGITELPTALSDLVTGRLNQREFLQRFGHRAGEEMELAQPRWREDPEAIQRLTRNPALKELPPGYGAPMSDEAWFDALEIVVPWFDDAPQRAVESLPHYLMLREAAKHYFMMGYALIRDVLMELDRRHDLQGGVFFLTPAELPRVVAGEDLGALIRRRRRRRTLALSLEVPQVLFSDDLDAIGRPLEIAGAETFQGVPLSAGVAEGTALVLTEPTAAAPGEDYILVCPSTDPAWVPLFIRASGLVMETGGVLSHGAIVAREFGLPAVAGLPDVHRRLRTGQRLRVDGATGQVAVLS